MNPKIIAAMIQAITAGYTDSSSRPSKPAARSPDWQGSGSPLGLDSQRDVVAFLVVGW